MLLKELHNLVQERYTDEQYTATFEFTFDDDKPISKADFEKKLDPFWDEVADGCGFGNGWEYQGNHKDPDDVYIIEADSSDPDTDLDKLEKALQKAFGADADLYVSTNKD